jgi:hypothetical protein
LAKGISRFRHGQRAGAAGGVVEAVVVAVGPERGAGRRQGPRHAAAPERHPEALSPGEERRAGRRCGAVGGVGRRRAHRVVGGRRPRHRKPDGLDQVPGVVGRRDPDREVPEGDVPRSDPVDGDVLGAGDVQRTGLDGDVGGLGVGESGEDPYPDEDGGDDERGDAKDCFSGSHVFPSA